MIVVKVERNKYITVGDNTVFELQKFPEGFAVIIKISNNPNPNNREFVNMGNIPDAQIAEEKFNAMMIDLAQVEKGDVVDWTIYREE